MAGENPNFSYVHDGEKPLAIRLGASLQGLAEDPERSGAIYQAWGSKKEFVRILGLHMIVETGFDPDSFDPDSEEDVDKVLGMLDDHAQALTSALG